jgi:hypothetical protein
MSQKIEFELAANDTSAKAAWERQQKAINGVIEKLGKLEDAAARQSKKQEGWLSKGATQLAGMAAGYLSVTGAINGVIASNQQMLDQADEVSLKYDAMFRKLRVQGALTEAQSDEAKAGVLGVAKKYGFTAEETAAASTQLISSGFSAKEGTGASLDAFIAGAAASNLQGQDTTRLAMSVTQLMQSQGKELNAENLREVVQGTQRLFEANNIQLADLEQLAGKGLSFKGRASMPELLGMMTVGKDVLGADTASTGIKIFGERLMGAKGDKQRTDVLKKMGLTPEDVDMAGESVGTVLDRMAEGMNKLKPEERAGQMQKLFGTEAAGFASLMVDRRDKLDALVAQQSDRAGFDEAVKRATSGKGAARRRSDVLDDEAALLAETGFKDKLKSVRRADRDAGEPEFSIDAATAMAKAFRYVGFSDETALSLGFGNSPLTKKDGSVAKGLSDAEALKKSAEEQTALLKDIAKSVAKPPVKIVKPDVPVTPVGVRAGR